MGSKDRLGLPVLRSLEEAKRELAGNPTVDAARDRLGGRAESSPGVGRAVVVPSGMGTRSVGIVVYASERAWDVWIGAGRVRRSPPEECEPWEGNLEDELAGLAADARLFSTMREGGHVRWQHPDGSIRDGMLVEKCRYGGLVLSTDDKIVAVGFRQLWPAAAPGNLS